MSAHDRAERPKAAPPGDADRAKQGLQENREALASSDDDVRQHGVPLERFRQV